MKSKWILAGILVLAVLLALAVGLAQGPGPEGEVEAEETVGPLANVTGIIPIQGYLTDASGNPLDGTYRITATLYTASTGGTALCSDGDDVDVSSGFFTMRMNSCSTDDINGRPLYLGIQVGDDPEMTSRQPIYPVPYAWSLKPGAIISNTNTTGRGLEVWSAAGGGRNGTALWLENTNTGGGIALWAKTRGTDTTLVVENKGSGPFIKAFGSDGGEDEFRLNNDGSIESKADSYIFVPGTEATLNAVTPDVNLKYYGAGHVVISAADLSPQRKYIQFGVVLPGILYGQEVKLEELTVSYKTSNSASYIERTRLYLTNLNGTYSTIIDDSTPRNSTTATHYSVTPSTDTWLSADEGLLSVVFWLNFDSTAHTITIYGLRLRLGHHYLY